MARVHPPSARRHRRGHVRADEPDAAQEPVVVDEPHNVPLQFLERDRDRRLPPLSRRRGGGALGAPCARGGDPGGRSRSASPSPSSSPTRSSTRTGTTSRRAARCFSSRARSLAPAAGASAPRVRRPLLAAGAVAVRARRRLLARGAVARAAQLACRDARAGEARALVRPALGRRAHGLGRVRGRSGNPRTRSSSTATRSASSRRTRETWYALGAFYFEYKQWALAYDALNNSYTYDRFGPARRRAACSTRRARRRSATRRRALKSAQDHDDLRALELRPAQAVDRCDEADARVVREPARLLHPAGHVHHHRPRVVVALRVLGAADAVARALQPRGLARRRRL